MLPVQQVFPELLAAARTSHRLVLTAPPGSGKTTLVPLELLRYTAPPRRILMLEPRRLAARAAASRMAALLGEETGRTVGYQVRMERRMSPDTRILVVTEGILTRMLRDDPELAGVDWVLFDEFHERNLQSDLGLALTLECQETLRDESCPLRILVMSATLDTDPLAHLLRDVPEHPDRACPVIRSDGQLWPVETRYLPSPQPQADFRGITAHAATAVRLALASETGSILVFLPGAAEIRAVERLLLPAPDGVDIHPLYGELSLAEQDAAIAPSPKGRRKVVLATSIAESSLTIEGVRIVIDSGLARVSRFDAGSGMGRLVTEPVSLAGAAQRRGRAGRLEAGICYRLWRKEDEITRRAFPRAEILEADLADLRLELAIWHIAQPEALRWLDTPPPEGWRQATELLLRLGALERKRASSIVLAPHGAVMGKLPLHPRLAHMLLAAQERGLAAPACLLAAMTGERDILRTGGNQHGFNLADTRLRLATLADMPRHRLRLLATRLQRLLEGIAASPIPQRPLVEALEDAGILLALAYPERVAMRRKGSAKGQFLMRNGKGASLDETDPLADADFLGIGEVDNAGRNARIFQTAPLTREDVETLFSADLEQVSAVRWDPREEIVCAREQTRLDALVLSDALLATPSPSAMTEAVIEGIRTLGIACLPWTDELIEWRARVLFLRCLFHEEWPDVRDAPLSASLDDWLAPYLDGIARRTQFDRIPLRTALAGLLDYSQAARLRELAPEKMTVPTGSAIRLHYPEDLLSTPEFPEKPEPPVLAVKLQELFGLANQPTVANGRMPVRIHLLSPAGKILQVTSDLAGFWKHVYPEVRKEMRGRYPKHPWPEDPLAALPTRRAKPRGT